MNLRCPAVIPLVLLLNIACLVQLRNIPAARNPRHEERNNNISFNKCDSDKVCIHGVCNFRTLKCNCYVGWTGEVCDKLIWNSFSPRMNSKHVRRDTQEKTSRKHIGTTFTNVDNYWKKPSRKHIRTTFTKVDRYLAELLSIFIPQFKTFLRQFLAISKPCTENNFMPNANSTQCLHKHHEETHVPTESHEIKANLRNIDDVNSGKNFGISNVDDQEHDRNLGENVFHAKTNRSMSKTNANTTVGEVPDASLNDTKVSTRTSANISAMFTDNTFKKDDMPMLNSMDNGSRLPDALTHREVHSAEVVSLTAQTTVEIAEEIEHIDDVCQEHYKLRPISERMCMPGLVCKFGSCSSEHKGSHIVFGCSCDSGAVGLICDKKCCLDCGKNGMCDVYNDSSEHCTCKNGYHGSHCELNDA